MSTRSRKEAKKYSKHLKDRTSADCDFCLIDKKTDQLVKETKSFKIIKNIFPYSLWEIQPVNDHLLIVPKIHTDTLSDLNAKDAKEFVEIMSEYEKQGYNVYARAPQNTMKTIVHQHTHLIKISGRQRRTLLTIVRPFYFRFPR